MKPDTNKQQGFSLIEVLVAGFVITFGLVGMVLMQTYTQQDAFRAHQLSLAGLYAQDMQERLRANICYLNSLAPTDSDDNINVDDTSVKELVNGQLSEWQVDHNLTARGWNSDLDYDSSELESSGYWEFELSITPPQPSRSETVQTLLIDYRDGDCEE
ncbi:prepilin-type N-terminal cleavage/methylation domain-containing protein [Marinospirillum sp.]|uniref:prepilin-type N-terminal cleavage/methylation domain-containing protein n=1 Tax=Marinospirillum sp. TaxID=2183934 RepID=UPI00384A68AE